MKCSCIHHFGGNFGEKNAKHLFMTPKTLKTAGRMPKHVPLRSYFTRSALKHLLSNWIGIRILLFTHQDLKDIEFHWRETFKLMEQRHAELDLVGATGIRRVISYGPYGGWSIQKQTEKKTG